MGIPEFGIAEIVPRRVANARDSLLAGYRSVQSFPLERPYEGGAQETHGHRFSGSADGYIDYLRPALRYVATSDYVVNAIFVVTGEEAEGEVYKINDHRTDGANAYEVFTGSRSLDRDRRRDGEWRFTSRSLVLDWSTKRPVDAAAFADFVANSPPSVAGPGDPSYDVLRWLARHGAP